MNLLQTEMSSTKAKSLYPILRPRKDIRPTDPFQNSPALSHIFSNSPTFTDNKHFGLALKPNETEGELQQSAKWGKPRPPPSQPSTGPFSVAT